MQFDFLRKKVEEKITVQSEDFDVFVNELSVVRLLKNEIWEKDGRISLHMGFVNSGALKECYLKDGNEYVNDFFVEGDFMGNYISYNNQEPSNTYTVATENTEVLSVPFHTLQALSNQIEDLMKFSNIIGQEKLNKLNNRSKSLLVDTPEERYDKLVNERAYILTRFPQYMIAQYLGIKPESLSRIRKKKIS